MKKLVIYLCLVAILLICVIIVKTNQQVLKDITSQTNATTGHVAENTIEGKNPEHSHIGSETTLVVVPPSDEINPNDSITEKETEPVAESFTEERMPENTVNSEETATTDEMIYNDDPPATREPENETLPTTIPESENNTPDIEM